MESSVSAIVCTFNYGQYLAEALDSLLLQQHLLNEIIVADDCSTDDTPRIMEKYTRRSSKIRYIRHRENIGCLRNFE